MKKRRNVLKSSILKTILIGAIISTPLFLTLSSCTKTTDIVEDESSIQMFNTQQILSKHDFSIPFAISSKPLSPVSVQIVNEVSEKITINEQQIFLDSTSGQINFQIDTNVYEASHFSFSVKFLFITSGNQFQEFQVDGVNIYYVNDPIVPLDEIICTQKSVSETNKHEFVYTIRFYKRPLNDKVTVRLVDDESNVVEFTEGVFYTEQEPGYTIYSFKLPIKISLSVSSTSAHFFSLQFNFVNSFGVEQETIIKEFNAFFISDPVETIPNDYYNIIQSKVDNKEHYTLLGLKPEISREESERYSIMNIPDNVTDIAPGAFIDDKWFRRIDYVKMGTNVESIGNSAFGGCTHLFELDLASNIGLSSWLNEDAIIFGDLDYDYGFAWFDDEINIDISLERLYKKGMWPGWTGEKKSYIIPDSFYVFDKNDPTKLIGIGEEEEFQLFKYGVVRLPRHTKYIAEHSLDSLGKHAFNPQCIPDGTTQRYFLIGEEIAEMKCLPRGIKGHVTFRSNKITEIGENLCKDLSFYPDDLTCLGSISYDLTAMVGLTTIGNGAFSDLQLDGAIIIPESVTKVGDGAFQTSIATKLIISSPVENLGAQCFCMYRLETIDLSIYTQLPSWLTNDELKIFNTLNKSDNDAIIYVNKNTSDDDLKSWETNLREKQKIDKNWTVIRRSY